MVFTHAKVGREPKPVNVYKMTDIYTHDIDPMRTNIVIDDDLMKAALLATGAKTKKEVVELGLKKLVQLSEQAKIRELRGTVKWEGDLDAMRRW